MAKLISGTKLSRLRHTVRVLRNTLRNPIEGLPPEVYHAPITRHRVLNRDVVHVMDPALIHEALVTRAASIDKGESVRRPLGPALGNGLLTAEGADWRWQRRAIAPIFRAAGLDQFVPAMLAAAGRSRDRLAATPQGETAVVSAETMRTTFDIIVETMLSGADGIDVDRAGRDVSDYLHQTRWANLAGLVGAPAWTPLPGQRRARAAAAYLRGQIEARVAVRRAERRERGDLVDLLLTAADPETGRRMTDPEITDNLLTFLTAGHETTALSLAWTLDLLGRHTDAARRVREELEEVTGGAPVGPVHLNKLTYLKQVFQEGLRLYPPAPLVVRRVAERFTLGGLELEPGMLLVVPVYAVHRHADLWEQPHAFDPERFRPEIAAVRPRHAFMPFGAGPRICIGSGFATMEAIAILAVLLRDLRFIAATPSPPPARMEITLRPASPLMMYVEGRALGGSRSDKTSGPRRPMPMSVTKL